ncbi:MAG: hypothetical protein H7A32_02245 [Deltaproteobacteria bacterium]|nr:hypothetical protein [Deltaproteobacteria bacterium]
MSEFNAVQNRLNLFPFLISYEDLPSKGFLPSKPIPNSQAPNLDVYVPHHVKFSTVTSEDKKNEESAHHKYAVNYHTQCQEIIAKAQKPIHLVEDIVVPIYEKLPNGDIVKTERTMVLKDQHAVVFFPSKIKDWLYSNHGFFANTHFLESMNQSFSQNEGLLVLSADQPGHGDKNGYFSQVPESIYGKDNLEGYPAHLPEQRAAVVMAWIEKFKELALTDPRFEKHAEQLEKLFDNQSYPYAFGHSMGGGDVIALKKENRGEIETIFPAHAWYSSDLWLSKTAKNQPPLARGVLKGYAKEGFARADVNFTSTREARRYFSEHPELIVGFASQMQNDNGGVDENFLKIAMLEAASDFSAVEKVLDDPDFIRELQEENSATAFGQFDTRIPAKWGKRLAEKGITTYAFPFNHVDIGVPKFAEQMAELAAMHFRQGMYYFNACDLAEPTENSARLYKPANNPSASDNAQYEKTP